MQKILLKKKFRLLDNEPIIENRIRVMLDMARTVENTDRVN